MNTETQSHRVNTYVFYISVTLRLCVLLLFEYYFKYSLKKVSSLSNGIISIRSYKSV